MGGPFHHRDEIAACAARQDPVEIPRADLRDHLADLDQVYAAIASTADPNATALLECVLCSLHARVFLHLPDGRV